MFTNYCDQTKTVYPVLASLLISSCPHNLTDGLCMDQEGKEYDDGALRFEGEYLNGLRNGKGKEYYYNGKLEFEGEYSNGTRNEKGKQYDFNGKLIFSLYFSLDRNVRTFYK